jgi:2-polyprenyl-3-methyl-5-hydroxy-6-metoxy-1,4-benzoquinol methylase
MENYLRPSCPSVYKVIKFGIRNINTPEYWDKVWEHDTVNRDYRELFNLILERIPLRAKVLDAGCGVGNLARLMRERRNARVTCLDFSSWACEQLEREGFETVVSALPRIPMPDDSFDVVVATEVLEHLDEPEETIRQMVRVVRDRGIVICSVPNDTMHPHEELEHQHVFDKERLQKLLSQFTHEAKIISGPLHKGGDHEFLLGYAVVRK